MESDQLPYGVAEWPEQGEPVVSTNEVIHNIEAQVDAIAIDNPVISPGGDGLLKVLLKVLHSPNLDSFNVLDLTTLTDTQPSVNSDGEIEIFFNPETFGDASFFKLQFGQ